MEGDGLQELFERLHAAVGTRVWVRGTVKRKPTESRWKISMQENGN